MPKVRARNSTGLQTNVQRVLTLLQRGMLSDAEKICQDILKQSPNHFDALHISGIIALQTDRAGYGVALIAKAIAAMPGRAEAYNHLGTGYADLGRYQEAWPATTRRSPYPTGTASARGSARQLRRSDSTQTRLW